jgi:hypothetical protein
MNDLVLLIVAAIGILICFTNWRTGFLLCLAAGCLQDPIRKSIPGEPIYITGLVYAFTGATFIGAYMRGVRFNAGAIHAWNKSLQRPLMLFFGLVIIQSLITLVRYDSPVLALIGCLAYMSPIPAILLGYRFGRSEKNIQVFIKVYLAVNVLMIAGVYLSSAGFDWTILRTVGDGLIVYSPTTGEEMLLKSGFYRAPEMAAWHAATSICLLVIMFLVIKRNFMFKLSTGALIIFFWGGLLFTGRRKFIVEIFIFLCTYGTLLLILRNSVSKAARASFLLMIVIGIAIIGYFAFVPDEFKEGIDPYYERGATVQVDTTDRASLMTVESFQWVLAQNGPFGSGAGTGSQGAQYFGGGGDLVGYSAEGGLAKVMAELGIPGLILLMWMFVGLGQYFWAIVHYVKNVNLDRAVLTYGLIAILVGNVAVFITAHQIYGDPLVLILLGFIIGFVMSVPQMKNREVRWMEKSTSLGHTRKWTITNAMQGNDISNG